MDNNDKYVGQFLDNRYEIIEKIGSGGMAVVYKARCHRLNRLVAIKILKDELSGDADFRRRFRSESQAVAMLSHPNIVAVYDVSRSGNIEYIVMELIEGITLKQYINRKGLLNWKEALHFATQVAKALSHAHSRGIIHRDIKPHNIMILKDGSVKVADFGIARLQSMQNTLTQEALGSVHYISPEQAKGGHVDTRSDIYSMGVVLYEMLTSHLPFEGDSAVSVAIQHISAIPLMPRDINPDIPIGLEAITMHAMEPDLNLRYASADDMLVDLEEFRKNPAINFTYYVNDTSGRYGTDQATRQVPSGAIAKVENTLPKPVRTPVRKAEMTKEEYRRSSKRASKTSTLIAVFLIIAFLAGAVIFITNVLKPFIVPTEGETITVPKFIGRKYSDILENEEWINTYNFTPEEDYSDDAAAGIVIDQSKPQNRQIEKTEKLIEITLTVSKGPKPAYTMPDFINEDYRNAEIELKQMPIKLEIIKEDVFNDRVTADCIIETRPPAGDELVEDQPVYLIYSKGPENRDNPVPSVLGLSLESAKRKLEDMKFVAIIERSDNDPIVPEGYIISQNPPANEMAPYKSAVYLVVSAGPLIESPSPSPSESPSPSTTDPEFPGVSESPPVTDTIVPPAP
ncbi:MAG: Stk1 family PASTA domain-containing Ser/Thr kinase [Clostridiales bacterium]|nr:Stk1 family PASTA domain-containing Ser/Thr kinase [Clostridiales bacterium]